MNLKQKQLISLYFPELQGAVNDDLNNKVLRRLLEPLALEMKVMKGDDGKDGYTPIKGKDYWTAEELDKVIAYILSLATPVKGKDYEDGKDYVLTSKDKREIASNIKVPIVEKVIEKREIIKEIPQKIDFEKELEPFKKKIDDGMALIQGRVKLIDMRWHGAGLSKVSHGTTLTGEGNISSPLDIDTSVVLTSVAHDSTLTGLGTIASPLSVIGGGGSGTQFQTPTSGDVDGVNCTFVWATEPETITVDQGRAMQKISTNGEVNWTGTTTTILTVAPTFDIYSNSASVSQSTIYAYKEVSTNYTVLSSDYTVNCTSAITVTLPTAVGAGGKVYNLKNTSSGSVTVNTTSSQLIDGELTQSVLTMNNMKVQSTGTGWIII